MPTGFGTFGFPGVDVLAVLVALLGPPPPPARPTPYRLASTRDFTR